LKEGLGQVMQIFTGWMPNQPAVSKHWSKLKAVTSTTDNHPPVPSFLHRPPDCGGNRRCRFYISSVTNTLQTVSDR